MLLPLSEALAERGYDKLTPVQEAVSDPDLATQDLLVSAQTGSGKTVGFGLAIAPTLLEDADRFGPAATPLALVVAPTRELAFQVKRELDWLYEKTGAWVTSCVGGMDMRTERRALDRGAHIVVGTPGRLRDHIERGSLDMSALRVVVLDEADEMLDLGFRDDLEFMLGQAPEDRRTLMFSATVPPTIAKMAQQFQRSAQRINTLGGTKQHDDIAYQAIRVAERDREHAIFNLLRFHDAEGAIVFANTRVAVSHLTARLANRGFSVVSLSGELSQTERAHALQAMRDGRARVCVATDVAARGIDLPNLNLVIHADLPTNTEGLLHRSGRTGRAGRKGISALIVPPKTTKKAERILKWAKITAEWVAAPSADDILQRDEERLMSDPAWKEPLTEDQTEFAARLLAQHTPEAVAAAYLRLYRSRQSAPEDLLPPETSGKPEARDRKPFGPSRWFALSVGRDDRAEPRWPLPMLCRVGNFDKTAIGAIRVQAKETFVELSEESVPGFVKALGENGLLEKDVTVRQLDKAPDLGAQGGDRFEKPRKPRRDGPGPRNFNKSDDRPKPAYKGKGKPDNWSKPGGKGKPEDRSTPAAGGKGKSDSWSKPASGGKGKPDSWSKPAKGGKGKSDSWSNPATSGKGKPKPAHSASSAGSSDKPKGKAFSTKNKDGAPSKPYAPKAAAKPGTRKPRLKKATGDQPPRRKKH